MSADPKPIKSQFNTDGTHTYAPKYDLPGRHLWRSSAGAEYSIEATEDGKMAIHSTQDVYSILEYNKAQLTENNGYNWDKSMRRCASIPHSLRLKWLIEEGWDAWNPDHEDMLNRKLNDSDFRDLRTAPGRV